jgi:hypothetical protein
LPVKKASSRGAGTREHLGWIGADRAREARDHRDAPTSMLARLGG